MKEVLDFLELLRDHNDREWFDAHRADYKRAQQRFNDFVAGLIEGIAAFDPEVRGLTVHDCTYRINRDTRFSADKSPYKTHMGGFVCPHGKKSGYAGYYFHLEPPQVGWLGGCSLWAGSYMPESPVLRSIREEIFDNGAEFVRSIEAAEGFTLSRDESLKRTPTGFPSGSPYDDLLKLKHYNLVRPMDDAFLAADDLLERTVEAFRQTQPFIAILNRAIRYAHEEMM